MFVLPSKNIYKINNQLSYITSVSTNHFNVENDKTKKKWDISTDKAHSLVKMQPQTLSEAQSVQKWQW